LTIKEEHTRKVLRKMFGIKRGEIGGDWGKLHNEEFYDFYFLPDVSWVTR
jgi:hypothetical protein